MESQFSMVANGQGQEMWGIRNDYLATETKGGSENKTFGYHLLPHVFLVDVGTNFY